MNSACRIFLVLALASTALLSAQTPPMTPDFNGTYVPPTDAAAWTRREVMIPMRDGVKLHTVIVLPRGAKGVPIILTRTPYDASGHVHIQALSMAAALPHSDDVFAGDIVVFQDIRGKYGSEGNYIMTRPPRGPLNKTGIDESTDAWDTIDWLVKNVHESNGRVGMIGSSYEGFTVAMALLDPHPALKVAAPESPMVDTWMGDDDFHYGAFRQKEMDFFAEQTEQKAGGLPMLRTTGDDYEAFRRAGSAGDYGRMAGLEQLPWWRKVTEHPSYDGFWSGQALERLVAVKPPAVPTLWLQGLWDQEDMWGAVHCYAAVESRYPGNDRSFLVLGPWRHSQIGADGSSLGPLKWKGDTALEVRRDVIKPFFDQYLVPGSPKAATPKVLIYNTGENHWDTFPAWPPAWVGSHPVKTQSLYLEPGFGLGFNPPASSAQGFDAYVSDPANPVPYVPRPLHLSDRSTWTTWLVSDQRAVDGRPDILCYATAPLAAAVRISGAPVVRLFASTSGTDSDWVVKVIDVYPDEFPAQPEMAGYELPIGMDIFRGRYRTSFEHPAAIAPGAPLEYTFALPNANHVFLPGHRIMVQVQSSWFPLYDRNPQTFVPNIFFAKPADYVKAEQRIYREGALCSRIELPVVQ